jgi:hypothetical protein
MPSATLSLTPSHPEHEMVKGIRRSTTIQERVKSAEPNSTGIQIFQVRRPSMRPDKGPINPMSTPELGYVQLDARGSEPLFQILAEARQSNLVQCQLPLPVILIDPQVVWVGRLAVTSLHVFGDSEG